LVGKTNKVGNIAEAKILADLAAAGFHVLIPFGDGGRYDLAVDVDGKLVRIQCKSGVLKKGVVIFRTYSMNRDKEPVGYKASEIDFFASYCPETDEVYYVPIKEAATRTVNLRVSPTRNNQEKGIKYAKDYVTLHL